MFGRLLGKALALPLRVANVPFKAANKVMDGACDELPNPLTTVADLVENSVAESIDGEEER